MPRITVLTLSLVLCLSCLNRSPAATWDRLGPNGGKVPALAVAASDPKVVYAGGPFVYRSTDGGVHWSRTADVFAPCGPEASPPIVTAIAVSPRDPNRAAASSAQGLFLTTDGGATWKRAGGIASGVSATAFSSDGRRLYASVGETLYRSLNAGDTWDSVPVPGLAAMCGDPRVGTSFYAVRRQADAQGKIMYRTDDGTGWYPYSPFAAPGVAGIQAMAGGDAVYVASPDAAGGVWRIARDGSSATVYPKAVSAIAASRLTPPWLLIAPASGSPAVVRTPDDGTTLETLVTGVGGRGILVLAVGLDQTPLAGTERGGVLALGSDNVWRPSNSGLAMATLTLACQSTDSAKVLLAAAGDGLYRSTNGGDTWALCHASAKRSVMALSAKPGRVWHTGSDGLSRSEDNGLTWRLMASGLPANVDVGRIITHPTLADTVYIVTATGAIYSNTTTNPSWDLLAPAFPAPPATVPELAVCRSQPTTLFAVRSDGLYRSTDSGLHWTLRSNTIPPQACLAVTPGSADVLYAAVTTGTTVAVRKSTNGGAAWTTVRTEAGATGSGFAASFIAVDPRQPNRVLVGTNRGLRISDDGGGTWRIEAIGAAGTFTTGWSPCGSTGDLLATAGAGALRTRPAVRGAMSASDALKIIALALSPTLPSPTDLETWDVNEDGAVTMADADLALRSSTGP